MGHHLFDLCKHEYTQLVTIILLKPNLFVCHFVEYTHINSIQIMRH